MVSAIRLLELTGADLQEKIAVVFAVGVDLAFFKNIKAHEIKPDQVHGVLIQMQIILFAVALSELGVLTNDRAEVRIHLFEITERVMLEGAVNEDFCLHTLCYAFINI